jgi:hypothetical protein
MAADDLVAFGDSRAFFDLDNDGFAERVGWVAPDDALLAMDRNGNGRIDDRTELFGGSPSDGFASLRTLDSNGDGKIDAADPAYASLLLWRDLNGDGASQAGELQSLAAAAIASLSLTATRTNQVVAGNTVTDLSGFRHRATNGVRSARSASGGGCNTPVPLIPVSFPPFRGGYPRVPRNPLACLGCLVHLSRTAGGEGSGASWPGLR